MKFLLTAAALLCAASAALAAESTYRLHDGVTAFVVNPDGKELTVTLDVRDTNLCEAGPREVLVKIYDPQGKSVVREVIPDDGITEPAYTQPAGAWDHEAWYYAFCRMNGADPMIRWGTYSDPRRLAALAKRTFTYKIPGGVPGIYRVMLVGSTDHYVTMRIDPELAYGVAGHPTFIHGHGEMFRRSFIYVPRGALGLYLVAGEWDTPRARRFKLTAPDGQVLLEADTLDGFANHKVDFESPGQFDDQLLVLEVSEGKGDFILLLKHRFGKDPEVSQRGERAVAAVLAPDAQTAKAIQGGAIYHDGRLFWQMHQARLHDWLKALGEGDFVVKDENGDEVPVDKLPQRPGFVPLNANHWRPPLSDVVMHHWPAHRNRAALNLALRDLAAGLRSVGPNDHVAVAVGGPFANMGYEFSNYAWHYWRPAWRILQESDAPDEVKDIVREAFLACGDRLAFCRSWARVNGNSMALVPAALRYCAAATGDLMQQELFEVYFDRFANGGWGDRVGLGPSGSVQEGFAYAYHYASYAVNTWRSVLADFQDERFQKAHDRMRNWFSYTLAEERIPAGPWSSRTHYYPQVSIEREGPFAWKGLPGPDFTVSVNDADEWFAARRKSYYALTYHGRLSPVWNGHANAGACGFGGGVLCQLHVPDRGPVLASTLNGDYGRGMHLSQWRNFHIHSLVGTTADGRPLVAADSEHFNAKLEGNTVTGSGQVRTSLVGVTRSWTFGADSLTCRVSLGDADQLELVSLWTRNPLYGKVTVAYEMIPFVPNQVRQPKVPTLVSALDVDGKEIGALSAEPVAAKTIVVDRGGFGVRIELNEPRQVHRGENNTVMIEIVSESTPAAEVALEYRLVPYVSE